MTSYLHSLLMSPTALQILGVAGISIVALFAIALLYLGWRIDHNEEALNVRGASLWAFCMEALSVGCVVLLVLCVGSWLTR